MYKYWVGLIILIYIWLYIDVSDLIKLETDGIKIKVEKLKKNLFFLNLCWYCNSPVTSIFKSVYQVKIRNNLKMDYDFQVFLYSYLYIAIEN